MPELFSFFLLLLPRMNTVTALLHMFFLPGNPDIRREKLPPASGEI